MLAPNNARVPHISGGREGYDLPDAVVLDSELVLVASLNKLPLIPSTASELRAYDFMLETLTSWFWFSALAKLRTGTKSVVPPEARSTKCPWKSVMLKAVAAAAKAVKLK